MNDPAALLPRHVPVLRYDSQEPYFADSPAIWTANPGNELRRADGTILATVGGGDGHPELSLQTLSPGGYPDPRAGDRIADTTARGEASYVSQAAALHADPRFANRVYGHVATDGDGRTWLAYWFFYFYNDFNLVGPFLHAGCHEGDWEMIQLRLDAAGSTPDLAVYAQHRHAGERAWDALEREGERPVVYPARGSHASYFSAGVHWTGEWFDNADGAHRGPELTLHVLTAADGWAQWPGLWGGTVAPANDPNPLDDSSPRGPGHHAQWTDPGSLLATAREHDAQRGARAAPAPPATPRIAAAAHGADLRIVYDTGGPKAVGLVLATGGDGAPRNVDRVRVDGRRARVTVPGAAPAPGATIHVSLATADGASSPSRPVTVNPA